MHYQATVCLPIHGILSKTPTSVPHTLPDLLYSFYNYNNYYYTTEMDEIPVKAGTENATEKSSTLHKALFKSSFGRLQ